MLLLTSLDDSFFVSSSFFLSEAKFLSLAHREFNLCSMGDSVDGTWVFLHKFFDVCSLYPELTMASQKVILGCVGVTVH